MLLVISCGEWGWEKVESDYESELNVVGLISTDTSYLSFVSVHRTLKLDEREHYDVYDTIWFGSGQYDYIVERRMKSAYVVEDAQVTVYDDENAYALYFVGSKYFRNLEIEGSWETYRNMSSRFLLWDYGGFYFDSTFQFYPEPQKTYTIEIISSNGEIATGIVTTPPRPNALQDQTPDTVSILSGYKIAWEADSDHSTIIKAHLTEDFSPYWFPRNLYLKPEETSWYSQLDIWDRENIQNSDFESDSMVIDILSLDPYFDEYIRNADDEFLSQYMGIGAKNLSINVEGGIGLITSMSVNRIERVVVK